MSKANLNQIALTDEKNTSLSLSSSLPGPTYLACGCSQGRLSFQEVRQMKRQRRPIPTPLKTRKNSLGDSQPL